MLCWICNYSPNCSEGHFVSLDMSHSLTPLAVATHLPSVQNDPSLGNSHCISFTFASSWEAKVIRRIGNCSGSISVHVHINSQQLAHHFINHSWCRKDIHNKECGVLWNSGVLCTVICWHEGQLAKLHKISRIWGDDWVKVFPVS